MITVIAGVNGAGKSSIAGENIRASGGDYFNPDEQAKALRQKYPYLTVQAANAQAWQLSFNLLKQAIAEDKDFTFETTLGGVSISQALHEAIDLGREVQIFYCGLNSPELHIERVAERVGKGGHDIPEAKIRERWTNSIVNTMGLLKRCHAAVVYDNSAPLANGKPQLICLFAIANGQFTQPPINPMPTWAKPLATVAIERVLNR